MTVFRNHDGEMSSFRIVWTISTLTIVFTWAYDSIARGVLQPWPLDGLTTIALFSGSGIKTAMENIKPIKDSKQ